MYDKCFCCIRHFSTHFRSANGTMAKVNILIYLKFNTKFIHFTVSIPRAVNVIRWIWRHSNNLVSIPFVQFLLVLAITEWKAVHACVTLNEIENKSQSKTHKNENRVSDSTTTSSWSMKWWSVMCVHNLHKWHGTYTQPIKNDVISTKMVSKWRIEHEHWIQCMPDFRTHSGTPASMGCILRLCVAICWL